MTILSFSHFEHMGSEGYAPIAPEDIQRVKTIAQAAWA